MGSMYVIIAKEGTSSASTLEHARCIAIDEYHDSDEVCIYQLVATGRHQVLVWDDQQTSHECCKEPCNYGKPWDHKAQRWLKQEWYECYGKVDKIAGRLGRTRSSITSQIGKMLQFT